LNTEDEATALKDQVRELQSALNLGDEDIRITFLLPPQLGDILGVLLAKPVVTTETLQRKLGIVAEAKVSMYRLRKKMDQFNIKIYSQSHVGYWIEPADKVRIRQMVADRTAPEPDLFSEPA